MRNFAAPFLYFLLLGLFAASCERIGKKEEVSGPSERTFTVQTRKGSDLIKAKGVFASTQRIQIKSEFSGRIQEVSVNEGQIISRGDPLIKFEDEEELPLVLERQRAQLKEAEDLQELNTRLANAEASEELPEEVEELEESQTDMSSQARPEFEQIPIWVPPSGYWTPVPGLPEDAGGSWPRAQRNYAAMSVARDPEDAGGIWPPYWRREIVTVEEYPNVGGPGVVMDRLDNLYRVDRNLSRLPPVPRTLTPVENVQVTEENYPTEEGPLALGRNTRETESLLSLDQAKVDRMKAELALTERQLAERSISSPIGGLVEKVTVKEDSTVEPDEPLIEIVQVDPIELILKIPKEQIDKIERGLEVTVSLADQPEKLFYGEISFIGTQLDADKKMVEVRTRIANSDFQIKPGMEGTAEIAVGTIGER